MFARLLEMTTKPQKSTELIRVMKEEALPILKKYNGFFDIIQMEVEAEPNKIVAISLWRDKTDLEKYERENFAKVKAMYEPFLAMPILVRLCKVNETISKKAIAVAA